ncbi:hypothetical protein BC938DRAFT_473708 [Jimgerdemannia flammicorona]|uniref:Peptidase C14 caspase domain-containing protein n=1 Tax=Jimgerdemannia flammicorona TaxID=994334 RepID=A0A433QT34_9FUNG|nr:hypothetical protein BC938DRAFT_473708 [Jimgerdemannia flammicorona]
MSEITFDPTHAYAIVIGTGTNKHGEISRNYESTINDAICIKNILIQICKYSESQVELLVGKQATYEAIETAFVNTRKRIEKNNDDNAMVVVFFSGHGTPKKLFPFGGNRFIDGDFVYCNITLATRVLLLINACYSGSFIPNLFSDRQRQRLSLYYGVSIISASRLEAETAYLSKDKSTTYSPFTIGLVQAFRGKTNADNGLVYVADLHTQCATYVSDITNGHQLPQFDFMGENFPVGYHQYPLDELELSRDTTQKITSTVPIVNNYNGYVYVSGINMQGATFGPGANFSIINN